jgi:phage gp46-like protein
MRKIEKEVIGAFVDGKTKTMGNTASALNPKTRNLDLLLHGNRIAVMSNRDGVKKLWVSNAGWPTRTTQSRLNALLTLAKVPARVYTRGKDYDGEALQWLSNGNGAPVNLSALRNSAVLVSVQ